jgi:hypothetical protein
VEVPGGFVVILDQWEFIQTDTGKVALRGRLRYDIPGIKAGTEVITLRISSVKADHAEFVLGEPLNTASSVQVGGIEL